MKTVLRFEANLLRILHFFLRRDPLEQVLPLLLSRLPRPPCLSRNAVELVQDSLAKGCVHRLARQGGWRRERFLRGEQGVDGRLWERTALRELGLSFSGHSLRFLIWATAVKLNPLDDKPRWQPVDAEWTIGDQLLLYFAYQALRTTEVAPALRSRLARNGLCRLAYPEDFTDNRGNVPVEFAPWTNGLGACILEVLQGELAERWLMLERGKGQITDWQSMQALGRAQETVLGKFFEAIAASGRRDLARFLLQAGAGLLTHDAAPAQWIGGLSSAGPRLADRNDTYHAALAFVRHVERLAEWTAAARAVGYLDEGYAASQMWKVDWEHWQGDELQARAQALIRQLEPF